MIFDETGGDDTDIVPIQNPTPIIKGVGFQVCSKWILFHKNHSVRYFTQGSYFARVPR